LSGKLAPETENPAPDVAAEFTVNAAEPVLVTVIVWVVAEFTFTLPKLRLGELTCNAAVAAFNCKVKLGSRLPALAEIVTVCAVVTAETVALKPPVAEPAAIVIEAGTETAELLLARLTGNPPVAAAAFSINVHASVPAPVIDALLHESPVNTGMPVPLKPMPVDAPDEELLTKVSDPETTPEAVGANCTVSCTEGFDELSVSGKLAPAIE
jgi:hypothetical protein